MKTFASISIALLLGIVAAAAGSNEAKQSPTAEKTAQAMRENIRAEVKRLGDHEWAGEYYAGDGLGVNTLLALAPKSGYVFEWHGCLGLYDRNYGVVTWTNGRIHLSFTFKNTRKGFEGIAPEFFPITWGSRHYLIPADELIGFCNSINKGREPRADVHGFYLLRRGDEKTTVTGFPKVPQEFQGYLLAKPIEAKIIAVGKYTTRPSLASWKFKDTPVTIDAGQQQGIRVGMEFVVTEPENVFESVRITKVQATRSEAIMTQTGEESRGPKAGWHLSTQDPWHARPPK